MATIGEVVAAINAAIAQAEEVSSSVRAADDKLTEQSEKVRATLIGSSSSLPEEALGHWNQASTKITECITGIATGADILNDYLTSIGENSGGGGTRSFSESKTARGQASAQQRRPPDFAKPGFDDRKLTDYVLNPDHPVGGHKARVIKSRTGLGVEDAAEVKRQILEKAPRGEPIPGKTDGHGSRWSVDLDLVGPAGTMTVRTAWIANRRGTRLVTVSFPPRERS